MSGYHRCSVVYFREIYIHSGEMKEEFLFCEELQTTSAGVLSAELQWKYVRGVCTDGASAMMGPRLGI